MVVRPIRHEFISEPFELDFEDLGVLAHLFLVLFEFGRHGLLEGDGQRGDGVIVWATLMAGEDGEVDWSFEIVQDLLSCLCVCTPDAFAIEDHSTTRSSKGFVGGGCYHVGVGEWRLHDAGRDQTGDVCDINDMVGADKISDLTDTGVVDLPAIRRSARNDHLWTIELSIRFQGIIVDDTGLTVDPVW